jgi:hypothetical protein
VRGVGMSEDTNKVKIKGTRSCWQDEQPGRVRALLEPPLTSVTTVGTYTSSFSLLVYLSTLLSPQPSRPLPHLLARRAASDFHHYIHVSFPHLRLFENPPLSTTIALIITTNDSRTWKPSPPAGKTLHRRAHGVPHTGEAIRVTSLCSITAPPSDYDTNNAFQRPSTCSYKDGTSQSRSSSLYISANRTSTPRTREQDVDTHKALNLYVSSPPGTGSCTRQNRSRTEDREHTEEPLRWYVESRTALGAKRLRQESFRQESFRRDSLRQGSAD